MESFWSVSRLFSTSMQPLFLLSPWPLWNWNLHRVSFPRKFWSRPSPKQEICLVVIEHWWGFDFKHRANTRGRWYERSKKLCRGNQNRPFQWKETRTNALVVDEWNLGSSQQASLREDVVTRVVLWLSIISFLLHYTASVVLVHYHQNLKSISSPLVKSWQSCSQK